MARVLGQPTAGAPHVDQWAALWGIDYPTGPEPRLTRAEAAEARDLIDGMPDLLGHLPAEVLLLLRLLIDRRDGASRQVLTWARSIDGEARS